MPTTTLPDARPGGESWQDISMSPGVLMSGGQQHKVTALRQWRNDHGAGFTDWRARCGADGVTSFDGAIDRAGTSLLRRARCLPCWGAPTGP